MYIDANAQITPSIPRRINGVRVKPVFTDAFIAY